MNAKQAENLRILIRFMEAEKPALYMECVHHGCGSPACAWGWAQTIPALDMHRAPVDSEACSAIFGIDYYATPIFGSSLINPWGRARVTAQEWATEARKALAENGYSMDDGFPAFMAKAMETLQPEGFKERTRELQERAFKSSLN